MMPPALPRLLPAIVLFFCAAVASLAQEMPSGPLPAVMPARAAWKIHFSYADESGGAPRSRFAVYFPKTISVEKSDGILREITVFRSGQMQERWIRGSREALRAPGSNAVTAGEGTPEDEKSPVRSSDFPDLDWLGPGTFRGRVSYQGGKALLFVQRSGKAEESSGPEAVPPLPVPFGSTRDRVAVLDAKTLRPLYFFDGRSARVYEYSASPSVPLNPPPEFAGVLNRGSGKD